MHDESDHSHGYTDLCEAGSALYAKALRAGRIARSEAESTPCLIDLLLLHPDPDDPRWLRPLPPATVLARLGSPLEREILERRKQTLALADAFEPFLAISREEQPTVGGVIAELRGVTNIDETIGRATTECEKELLTVQPGGSRPPESLNRSVGRVRPLVDRGVRIRSLYQHTARHSYGLLAYQEQVGSSRMELRTLEELVDRLIIIDRRMAFIPAHRDLPVKTNRKAALEIRHPGLIEYLVGVFEHLWQHAIPLDEEVHYDSQEPDGIPGVQRSIAKLLVEGHVDEVIADRLGMNVRTCRGHIAKLATALGSNGRAQLGYLIARSGILDRT
jgi:DNA-binding CsgD family transcriptional regulator